MFCNQRNIIVIHLWIRYIFLRYIIKDNNTFCAIRDNKTKRLSTLMLCQNCSTYKTADNAFTCTTKGIEDIVYKLIPEIWLF